MAQAQVDRWATLNPTVRHSGKILEGFGSYVLPRLAGIMAVSGIVWYANRTVGWIDKPVTVTPEFMAEVKKIGPVAVSAVAQLRGCLHGVPAFWSSIRVHRHQDASALEHAVTLRMVSEALQALS